MDVVTSGLKASADLKLKMLADGMAETIEQVARVCVESLKRGGRILLAGNGGSAADAQHIAAELVGRYLKDRPALAAIALTTDTSVLTSVANDAGYEKIFSRQIEAIGGGGDVFWAISTSGDSANLVQALDAARQLGVKRVCFLGKTGGAMKDLADISLIIPSDNVPRIQEAQMTAAHLVCEIIETSMGDDR